MRPARPQRQVDKWKESKNCNICALLASLQDVLWDASGWTSVGLAALVEPVSVKKHFQRACLLLHPDKVAGTPHANLALQLFMALNESYQLYRSSSGGGAATAAAAPGAAPR